MLKALILNVSDDPFTILAPVNSSKTLPEDLLKDEALTEEVITNHFIIGEEIRPEKLLKPMEKRTEGGQKLMFKIDKEGIFEFIIIFIYTVHTAYKWI